MNELMKQALLRFVVLVNERLVEYQGRKRLAPPPAHLELDESHPQFVRIWRVWGKHRTVFCFVHETTGDLHKPETLDQPAREPLGNLLEATCMNVVGPFGIGKGTSWS